VLLFFDVGGSMNRHVKVCEELFSAARTEFKHLEFFYFHNCLYESVWKDNRRRFNEGIPTYDVINRYGSDYKVIFVGDASMSPWEIIYPGGSVEHNNAEAGQAWLERISDNYHHLAWINPVPEEQWDYTQSIGLIQSIIGENMFPLSVKGLEQAMTQLVR